MPIHDYRLDMLNLPFCNNGLYSPATNLNTWNNFNWGSTFGGFNSSLPQCNFNTGIFPSAVTTNSGSTSTSTSASTSASPKLSFGMREGETILEYNDRMEKLRKQNETTLHTLQEYTKELSKGVADKTEEQKELEANKKEDGSSVKVKKLSEMSFFAKVGVAAKGAITGIIDMAADVAKTIAGFDKDGKWSLKRCLKGVGLTALGILACTPAAAVAVPILAYAAPALMVAGVAGGVAMAGIGTVKVVKAVKHDSAEEFKEGFAQIGAGAATAISAGRALKNAGGISGAFESATEQINTIKAIKSGTITSIRNASTVPLEQQIMVYNENITNSQLSRFSKYKNDLNLYKDTLRAPKITKLAENYNKQTGEIENLFQNLDKNIPKDSPLRAPLEAEARNLINADAVNNVESWGKVGSSIAQARKSLGWRRHIPWSDARKISNELKSVENSLKALKTEQFNLVKQYSKIRTDENCINFVKSYFNTKSRFGVYEHKLLNTWQRMSFGNKIKSLIKPAWSLLGLKYTAASYAKSSQLLMPAFQFKVACKGLKDPTTSGMGDIIPIETSRVITKEEMAQNTQEVKDANEQLDMLTELEKTLQYGTDETKIAEAKRKADEIIKAIEAQAQQQQAQQAQQLPQEVAQT